MKPIRWMRAATHGQQLYNLESELEIQSGDTYVLPMGSSQSSELGISPIAPWL